MTQPSHTPGPAQLPTGFESVQPDGHDGMPLFSNGDPFDTIAIVLPRKECNANGRLLAAAYNAFDSAAAKLRCNAVELSERMADGGIAELVETLQQLKIASCGVRGCFEGYTPSLFRHFEKSLARASAILDKVSGGVA